MLLTLHSNAVQDAAQLTVLLLWAIAVLAGASAFFIFFTLLRRLTKIKRLQHIRSYQKQTEELLFPLMFGTATMEETLESYKKTRQNGLMRSVLIRSVLALHRNYTGVQKTLLEEFFVQSKLCAWSLKKLRSAKWDIIIEGIREVSILNVHESFEDLKKLMNHRNKQVRKEAFVGLITLKGTDVLTPATLPEMIVDDWMQSCILYNLSTKQHTLSDLQILFQSNNESLVVLAARMVEYFQLFAQYDTVLNIKREFRSPKNRDALLSIKNRLNSQFIQ